MILADRLRICYVSNRSSPHVRKFLKHFRKDHDVSVILFSDCSFRMDGIKEHIVDFDAHKKNLVVRYVFYLYGILKFRRLIQRMKPHIVHWHYVSSSPLSLAFWGIRNLVISVWGNDVIWDYENREPFGRRLMKRFALKQALRITPSSLYLGQMTKKYLAPKDYGKLFVIPCGVDTTRFNPLRFKKKSEGVTEGIVIGCVKHLQEKYGIKYLIGAFALLCQVTSSLRLLIAGEGPLEEELKDLASSLGVRGKVVFTGFIENRFIPQFLSKIDIFVMPSVYASETLGVAALEASAMEIPVVASRIGGVPEAVIHRKTGTLVAPRDVGKLSGAILELIQDPTLRRMMGESGRQHVLDRFNLKDVSRRFETLYTSIFSSST